MLPSQEEGHCESAVSVFQSVSVSFPGDYLKMWQVRAVVAIDQ